MVTLSLYYVLEIEGVSAVQGDLLRGRLECLYEILLSEVTNPVPKSHRIGGAKRTTLTLTHDLHIYKAKFFPRMIRALLNIYAPEHARVVDPFCGSGTALLEASLLGLESYGIDFDPICELISSSKVTPFLSATALKQDLHLAQKAFETITPTADDHSAFPEELGIKLKNRDRKFGTREFEEVTSDAVLLRGLYRSIKNVLSTAIVPVLASDALTKKVRYRYVGIGNGAYTVEVLRLRAVDRFREKAMRCVELCDVFAELSGILPWKLGKTSARRGSAGDFSTWGLKKAVDIVITSPPYLPASSGREHYTSSRALSFFAVDAPAMASKAPPSSTECPSEEWFDAPEIAALIQYLGADQGIGNLQTDAMRSIWKLKPTIEYLHLIKDFFSAAKTALKGDGLLLLVVATQHVFYSHKRKEIEHVVNCGQLYSALAISSGFRLEREIKLQLTKHAASMARPQAKDEYFESVLVFRQQSLQ